MNTLAQANAHPRNWVYVGPGWQDWIYSFGMTILFAGSLQSLSAMDVPQSAESYYSKVAFVVPLHYVGMVINFLSLILVLVWIFQHTKRSLVEPALHGMAILGYAAICFELILALRTQPNQTFVLSNLPFQPIHGWGILGLQFFGSYLIFKAPNGRLATWQATIVKILLAICFWFFQTIVWQVLSAR